MNPKISIILPVYNVEKYIHKCIDSILAQTFTDFELILVDDGSTDNSGNICDEYEKEDARVRVIHKKNGGQSTARNLGLDIARGEYIGFVDSDDWIDNDMYRILIEHALNNDSDIVACNFYAMNRNGQLNPYTLNAIDAEYNKESAIKEIYTNKTLTFSPCNKIYKKNILENLRFSEGVILEDMDISYKIIYKSNKVSYLRKPLYYYRYNEKSTLRGSFSLKRLDEYMVRKDMYDFYLKNYPEISDLVYSELYLSVRNLYMLISVYHKDVLEDYKYLIEFDKAILRRLIKNKKLRIRDKMKIIMFLSIPKTSINIHRVKYKIRNRKKEV